MIGSGIDWTNVLVAFIVGLPALIGAIASLAIHSKVRTPSGTSIGKQVENALHTALANNYRLRAIGGEVEPPSQGAMQSEVDRADAAHRPGGTPTTEGGKP